LSTSYQYQTQSSGEHWVNLIAKGTNGMYSNVNRTFFVDLDPPTVTITSPIPQYSPSLSYIVNWTNHKCLDFTVYLNGTQIGGTYYNSSQSATINGLIPNADNLIQVVGRTAFEYTVSDSIIVHPYTGYPEIYGISPANGTKIWRSEAMVSWISNATLAGGIDSILFTTSLGTQSLIFNPVNSTYILNGFTQGSHWIHFTVRGRNGFEYLCGVNFTVDLSDTLAPIINITQPFNGQIINSSNLIVNCTISEQGGGQLDYKWTEIRNYTGALIANFTFFSSNFNYTLPKEGLYDITVYAKDAAWNTGTANVSVYFDLGPPQISNFIMPIGNLVNRNFEIFYSIIEGNLANITYQINSATRVLLTSNMIDVKQSQPDITDGVHILTLTAMDLLGQIGEQQAIFRLDMTAPTISIFNFPTDGIFTKNISQLELEVNLVDASLPDYAYYSLNAQTLQQILIQKTSTYGYFKINITEYGVYLLNISCQDRVSNAAEKQYTITFRAPVDEEPTNNGATVLIAAGAIAGASVLGVVGFKFFKKRKISRPAKKEEVKKIFGWDEY
jgi:hypothetical protein